MKRAIILHCWDGYPEYCWYPWAKQELEKQGFKVIVPALPDTSLPVLEKWLPAATAAIGEPDENTILIGHSAGSVTILRYFESLPEGQKVGGVVLVAGFTDPLGYAELEDFFVTPLDFAKIKPHCARFVLINSDDDPFVPLKHGEMLRDALGGELIIKHNAKHFSGAVDGEESCVELPEVISSVLRFV